MSWSITWEDHGLTKLQEALAELAELKLKVGYQDPEGKQKYESGVTVAKLAAIQEFGGAVGGKTTGHTKVFYSFKGKRRFRKKRLATGTATIPARSFIRSTMETKGAEISACQERELAKVIEGKATPVQAMSAIGSFMVRLIRFKLETAAGWAAPLDPDTVELKGSPVPLDETGLLSRSLSWRVMKGKQVLAKGHR